MPQHYGDPLFIPLRVSEYETPQSPQSLNLLKSNDPKDTENWRQKNPSLMRVISGTEVPPTHHIKEPIHHIRSRYIPTAITSTQTTERPIRLFGLNTLEPGGQVYWYDRMFKYLDLVPLSKLTEPTKPNTSLQAD